MKGLFSKSKLLYGVLFFTVLWLINDRQSRIDNFGCEICSDKAGYYMYLPALFHYGFEAENYPEDISQTQGNGFQLDHERNRVLNKYTSGVALLQLPFYGSGVLISQFYAEKPAPFSSYYMFFINIGAAFYLVLGLYFFRKWLNYSVSSRVSLLTMLIVFFGTNLYYYTVDESLMGHLYSFFLFSAILYYLTSYFKGEKRKHFILFCIVSSIAILLRPTNFLFVIIAFLFDVRNLEMLKERFRLFFKPRLIIYGLLIFLITITPQLLYWNFTYGKLAHWTYGKEGFTLWKDPYIGTVWFSPQGGMFTYTPIILVALVASILMFRRKVGNGILVLGTFLVISYMFASWTNPYFGFCNFGKRPVVEFLPILMLPIAYLFKFYGSFHYLSKYLILVVVLGCVYYNLALTSVFDTCFYGDVWDWSMFYELLTKS